MSYTLITAVDKNGLIGANNQLPWHISADLKFFKKQTVGKTVLMGRKTCQSLPFPLPQRTNLVLSRDPGFKMPGFVTITDLESIDDTDEIMVIGGRTLYEMMLPIADRLIVTKINHEFEGDTYFPAVDWDQWENVKSTYIPITKDNPDYQLTFEFYQRNKQD